MSGSPEGAELAGSRPPPPGSQVLEAPSSRAAVVCWGLRSRRRQWRTMGCSWWADSASARGFPWISNQSSTLAWSCGAAITPAADPAGFVEARARH
ncbi:hypothetical protein PVAP13_2NG336120 [Panicum virgatum]|uniref:Uncharacterized protein n=1 Tax=Panicum virgatum TaxID=38727 RepID=A0A8T0VNI9_PANVG|nr:hypothetical protein PVAP13_2NG336120 [Panicum virgatum]KAG2635149.1 hypothetical protein PVAP13_2NG336120 [Panicum virgatum]KAG2635150.1 hypothetical protein PVAP13_2NG336120 [Panicum virgatum]